MSKPLMPVRHGFAMQCPHCFHFSVGVLATAMPLGDYQPLVAAAESAARQYESLLGEGATLADAPEPVSSSEASAAAANCGRVAVAASAAVPGPTSSVPRPRPTSMLTSSNAGGTPKLVAQPPSEPPPQALLDARDLSPAAPKRKSRHHPQGLRPAPSTAVAPLRRGATAVQRPAKKSLLQQIPFKWKTSAMILRQKKAKKITSRQSEHFWR